MKPFFRLLMIFFLAGLINAYMSGLDSRALADKTIRLLREYFPAECTACRDTAYYAIPASTVKLSSSVFSDFEVLPW